MADGAGGAWTFGSSILTFAFPMILFIVVAGALYVLYTKPESVPGHHVPTLQRSVSYTAVPGKPASVPIHEARAQAAAEAAQARPAAAGTTGIVTGATAETAQAGPHAPATEAPATEAPATEAPGTEDAE
jgi:nicotinate-nucleotide--dimethylbenzimidazole phosphoribosyltransferase